ncbi:MAG TPA: hypothetical protein VLL51_05975, partial [Gemmatimonadales bacterium]|nr:hypothetical protein [Gemmatimonadales bacterium]
DAHASDGMLSLTNQEKAERLGAAFLVTTSLNRDSNGIRAIVNLSDDRMVLQEVWDYSLRATDPRRALEALVDSAATDLDGRLPAAVRQASLPGAAEPVYERRSLSPEIAGLVEQADSAVRTRTRPGLLQSITLLEKALTQDPRNGYLHARLSSAYALVTVYQYRADFDLNEAAARSLAHADRAIGLDPGSDEAFAARAYILNQVNAPTDSIRVYFEVARRLNPSAQPGWYSVLLMKEGKKDSALAEARRGVGLDPRGPGRRINLAWDALGLREDQLAVQEADSAWQLDRRLELARSLLVRSLLAAGQHERCASMDPGPFLGTQAACLEALGRREDAARQIDTVLARFRAPDRDTIYTKVIQAQELAIYFATAGEASASMFWVREAFRQAPNGMPWPVLRSRIFDRVRRNELFTRDLKSIETGGYPRTTEAARSYLAALTSLPPA